MTSETDGFSVAGEMWKRLSRRDIRKEVVPRTCGNNQELRQGWRQSTRRLVLAERKDCRSARSATRLSDPRYCGVSPCKTLYARTAILNWTRSGTCSQYRQTKSLSTLSQKSATVAEFGDCRRCLAVFYNSRTFLRQCGQALNASVMWSDRQRW